MIIEIITFIVVILTIIFLLVSFILTIFGNAPYISTSKKAGEKILLNAGIKKGDIVYDIGAGDGRLINQAEHLFCAKAKGFEINPFVYLWGKIKQKLLGWKGELIYGNMLNQDLSDADIILCYMMPGILKKFEEKFKNKLKKGAKIISYAFTVGSLKPIKKIPKDKNTSALWIYKI